MRRRVYDCFLFNGEFDTLEIRLNELDSVVDYFVLVEGTKTFSGLKKELEYKKVWNKLKPFWHKLRCVIVDDWPITNDPWQRERHQRNSILRGTHDACDLDLILLSDVDEIPKKDEIIKIRGNFATEAFGFHQSFFYFSLNFQNIEGPESNLIWTIGATKSLMRRVGPDSLRYSIRSGDQDSLKIENAGWHFSYLTDEVGIRKKIAAFSHQEFNNSRFLDSINLQKTLLDRTDFFGRPGFVWAVTSEAALPQYVLDNYKKFSHLILKEDCSFVQSTQGVQNKRCPQSGLISRLASKISKFFKSDIKENEPIIICCYTKPEDVDFVKKKFNLHKDTKNGPQFFFWYDQDLIGPEQAFQEAWNLFPDRDVIIIHTDMEPLPRDLSNKWYKKLLRYVEMLPDAGVIACDLLFPQMGSDKKWIVQCAGGSLSGGKISHLCQVPYINFPKIARRVDWVTFGGIYIRREVLDLCGGFDTRYKWAYVKDVDYSLEIRIRGYNLYQVPVNLLHQENGTTKPFLEYPEYRDKVEGNFKEFEKKWKDILPNLLN